MDAVSAIITDSKKRAWHIGLNIQRNSRILWKPSSCAFGNGLQDVYSTALRKGYDLYLGQGEGAW